MVEIVVELNVSSNDRAGEENLPVLNGEIDTDKLEHTHIKYGLQVETYV
jgi:hypothetical protein